MSCIHRGNYENTQTLSFSLNLNLWYNSHYPDFSVIVNWVSIYFVVCKSTMYMGGNIARQGKHLTH